MIRIEQNFDELNNTEQNFDELIRNMRFAQLSLQEPTLKNSSIEVASNSIQEYRYILKPSDYRKIVSIIIFGSSAHYKFVTSNLGTFRDTINSFISELSKMSEYNVNITNGFISVFRNPIQDKNLHAFFKAFNHNKPDESSKLFELWLRSLPAKPELFSGRFKQYEQAFFFGIMRNAREVIENYALNIKKGKEKKEIINIFINKEFENLQELCRINENVVNIISEIKEIIRSV